MGKLRVLLVAGSLEMSRGLRKILEGEAKAELAAEANNAYTARDKIIECNPDAMLLCDELPRMAGIEFLKKLMPQRSVNTLVLGRAELEKKAYAAGARAFVPVDSGLDEHTAENVCSWIRAMADMKEKPDAQKMPVHFHDSLVIAMGASTGGTEATAAVMRGMRKETPGIVMVQHMPEGFTQMYAERLNNEGELEVREAKTGDVVRPGLVLLAPGDKHMRLIKVNGVYQVECRHGEKVSGHCPSVDVLFESVAHAAGRDAIGVIMTGMGSDGAKGLLSMKKAGAKTIGQDKRTCVVYGMPKVAYDMGAVDYQAPLEQIANKIYYIIDKSR